MSLRDRLGAEFDALRQEGAESLLWDRPLEDLDKDELLAVIGWIGRRQRERREQIFSAIRRDIGTAMPNFGIAPKEKG